MRLAWLVLSALVIVVLGGCQQEEVTPAPTSIIAAIERANLVVAPSLLTLARNPGAFEGQDLILAGNYRPLPVPVCVGDTHRSPATWALSDGNVEVFAAGFDAALRELAAPGLPLEVEGRWQRWEGPVGCGRRAPSQLVWHLQLTNILSPNPLSAGIGGTPVPGEPSQTISTPSTIADAEASPGFQTTAPAGESLPGTPAGTAPVSPAGQTPSASVTPAPTVLATGSAVVTIAPTIAGSGTPSTTPNGTGTPTESATTSTPTATSGPTSGSPTPTVDSGGPVLLDYDDLSKRSIAGGGSQVWRFAGAADLQTIIRVAPSSRLDVALELLDPNGTVVGVYDTAGPGQTETIDESDLPVSGLYSVRVSSIDLTAGSYAIVLQSESSRPFVEFQGILNYGETRAGTTPVDGDHLWNFEGTAGDVVNIRVTATTSTDMQIYFNSHDGQETEFVNDNSTYFPPNDREEILGIRLASTGLYTVGIGEEDLESLGYTIIVERVP